MDIIKKSIIRITSFLRIPLNYSGLRVETLSLLKSIHAEKRDIKHDNEAVTEKEYILCFGDSNTFGWNYFYKDSFPFLLEQKLNSGKTKKTSVVINLGTGGAKIEDVNTYFLQYLVSEKNITAVLNYGLNDVLLDNIIENYFYKNKSNINWSRINAEDFADDLERIADKYLNVIKKFLEKNIKIIIIGLYKVKNTSLGRKWVSDKKYLNLQNDILDFFNEKIKEITLNTGTVFIDLSDIFKDSDTDENYLYEDRFHLNRKAYGIVAEKIKDILLKYDLK